MIKEIDKKQKDSMNKTLEALKHELSTLRAGRASVSLLDKIFVDYYGTPTPVNQMANISVPEARALLIQPWDKTCIGNIEKAILKSELGITPVNDGNIIRLTIPVLTEERRKELVKLVKKYGEEAKVVVRNARRDSNDAIKKLTKNGEVSEDDAKRAQDKVQDITDEYIKKVEEIIETKENEIMEI